MALYVNTNNSDKELSVNEITNNIQGSSGLNLQDISGEFFDGSYYTVNIPWNVSILESNYSTAYVSSNSLISFDIPSISGTSLTHTIFIGTPNISSTTGVCSKNFYYNIDGVEGTRTLRMRFEGEFKTNPQNITSTSIPNNLLGRQSLTEYAVDKLNSTSVFFQIPWNINFNIDNGEIQNGVRVYENGPVIFYSSIIANNNILTSDTSNALYLGYGPTTVGTGIWGGIEGSSPNRTYRIRYEGYDNIPSRSTAWEIIFYENNKDIIEVQTERVADFFSLDLNGFYFSGSLLIDLQNNSGNYSNQGTRFSQTAYQNSSLIWEATFYENDKDKIDVQLGERIDPTSSSILNYNYGLYYKDSSLQNFSSTSNSGYQILSSALSSTWIEPQSVYARVTPLGLPSQWKRIRNIYVRDSDIWRPLQTPPLYFFCKRSTYENDTYGNKGGTGIASFQNESFIVPSGVTEITVELWGGGGSGGSGCGNSAGGSGGGGGYVKATLSVTPGETLTIRVGGGAGHYASNIIQHPQTPSEGPATINVVSRRSDVNINNQSTLGAIAGSGGGYSAIFRGLTPLLVAGGGGGGGSGTFSGFMSYSGDGGAGGGNTGQNGANGSFKASVTTAQGSAQSSTGGLGGSQVSGGIGGSAGTTITCVSGPAGENGSFLQGGRGTNGPSAQGDNLIKHGSASNPGTNGGAAGGGSSRTGINVCNDSQGYLSDQSPIDPAAYKSQPIYFYIGIPSLAYDNYFYLQNALYASSIAGGGGGGGYYGGGGGSTGYHAFLFDTSTSPSTLLDSHSNGGSGGGGGSNYVGGAASVISNSQGNRRTPGNISSPYYLTTYLNPPDQNVSGIPFNAFAQGGVGYGGIGGFGSPLNNIAYGTRGENGLVVINW